jgi:acyl carrier protein
MSDPARLSRLTGEIARITGRQAVEPQATLSELGFDSTHLIQLMLASDSIYGFEVPFEMLDITVDMSVLDLHEQIMALPEAASLAP